MTVSAPRQYHRERLQVAPGARGASPHRNSMDNETNPAGVALPAKGHCWHDYGKLAGENVSWCSACDALAFTGREPSTPCGATLPASGPLRELGSYLARVLDEDQWATAEAMLLRATGVPGTDAAHRAEVMEGCRKLTEQWHNGVKNPDMWMAAAAGAMTAARLLLADGVLVDAAPDWHPCRDVDGATCADMDECANGCIRLHAAGVRVDAPPSIYDALPPSAMDWLTSSDPPCAASQEWRDGWDACRNRVRTLVDQAIARGVALPDGGQTK